MYFSFYMFAPITKMFLNELEFSRKRPTLAQKDIKIQPVRLVEAENSLMKSFLIVAIRCPPIHEKASSRKFNLAKEVSMVFKLTVEPGYAGQTMKGYGYPGEFQINRYFVEIFLFLGYTKQNI